MNQRYLNDAVPAHADEAARFRDARRSMNARRARRNGVALTLSLLAMGFGLLWLIWILFTVLRLGVGGLSLQLFTQMTPPPNTAGGGLANALYGSLVMVGLATVVGAPLGVLAGIYLVEYGRGSRLADTIRFINDLLLSAPSIVIGLFVYAVVVNRMHGFSALAGAAALALIEIPIVIRATENMLRLVPDTLREAAEALGVPRWKMVLSITFKASYAGILTGILLAIARISGETAPLLFTALSNQFFTSDLRQPMANLPVTIFKFAMSPFAEWQQLAWAGVFLITVGVLLLNIAARALVARK